jgi:WD40 repeat protein/tRNA A-37 threonylcarbamoyl transferase component Bud32
VPDCPLPKELERFLAKDIDDDLEEALCAHVEGCIRCQNALEELVGAARLSQAAVLAVRGTGPGLDEAFLQQLQAAPPHPSWSGRAWEVPVPFDTAADRVTRRRSDSPESPGPEKPPAIPGYEIVAELGRGGMGVVYKARQIGLNRMTALKIVRAGGQASAEDRMRFRAEAEAVASLQHPHIVQIYEVGEHEGTLFFSMEYIEGGSLKEKIQGLPQPVRPAVQLVETVARAVHYAHERGIVHRDLKPANILMATGEWRMLKETDAATSVPMRGSPLAAPKIADFGLAKRLDDVQQTQAGRILGTPTYMAPEQAAGRGQPAGPAVDVYALGTILFELLTGRPPFLADSSRATLARVGTEDPISPRRLQPKVPRDLETICLKCLEKDPQRRYASAQELAGDLRRFLANEPIKARPVGVGERLWKWARRRPAVAALSGLALLVAVLGFGLVTYAWREAEGAREAEAGARLKAERATQTATLEKARALDAQGRATRDKDAAELARAEAQRLSLILLLSQGQSLCSQGEVGQGLLFLAQGLELAARARTSDLERLFRINLAAWRRQLIPLQLSLPAASANVLAVAMSPGGKILLTGGNDQQARLWDVATGNLVRRLNGHEGPLLAAAFSPDGKTIVTASQDRTARLWEASTGNPRGKPLRHQAPVRAVAFHPRTERVLTGSGDRTARLWDAGTGQPIGEPLRHSAAVTAVAFSPDGKTVVTGCRDHAARLWDAATGRPLGLTLSHLGSVTAVAFSCDGKMLVTGSEDRTAQRWEVSIPGQEGKPTCKPLGVALSHSDAVGAAAFSPDGQTIWTGCRDQTVRRWDSRTGLVLGPPWVLRRPVNRLALSNDGRLLVCNGPPIQVWDVSTDRPSPRRLQPGPFQNPRIVFSPDGLKVLTNDNGNTAHLWDVATGQRVGRPMPHSKAVICVAFAADGRTMLTGSRDGDARLWRASTCELIRKVTSGAGPVRVAAFSVDGEMFATVTADNQVRLWAVADGKPLGQPLVHPRPVTALAFHPNGKSVLTGCRDGKVWLWDLPDRKPPGELSPHQSAVRAVAFSPDGKTFVTTSEDWEVRLWDEASREFRSLAPSRARRAVVAAFSPDGKALLTGHTGSAQARLWDVATGKPLGPPLAHTGAVVGGIFTRDGKTILTACGDGTLRTWPVPEPMRGDLSRLKLKLKLQLQVETGLQLDDKTGGVSAISPRDWRQRERLLRRQGGPALPSR